MHLHIFFVILLSFVLIYAEITIIPSEEEKIYVSAEEFCDGCHYTVERILVQLHKSINGENPAIDINSHEFALSICTSKSMKKHKNVYSKICMDLFKDHASDLMSPFLGRLSHVMLKASQHNVREHTLQMCHKFAHCENTEYVVVQPDNDSECTLCTTVIEDIEKRLNRYEIIDAEVAKDVLLDVCEFTKLRYKGEFRVALDDMCFEIVHGNERTLNKIILKSSPTSVFQNLHKHICMDSLDVCYGHQEL